MQAVNSIFEIRELRKQIPEPVGFVPTMGFLHEGHLSLVRQARNENKSVIVSIFVNPTQFGPSEDLEAYPRDEERDLALLKDADVDLVFMPEASEIYPQNFNSWVDVAGIVDRLEGSSRPGHFRGMATVVAKLFNITEPNKAYFGQKDAQQLRVIKKMVFDLDMKVEIVGVSTVREPDGLAMSSRNTYLNSEERVSALVLWKSLNLAKQLIESGELDAQSIRQKMISLIGKEQKATIDYVSIADSDTLQELDKIECCALVSLAVWIGKTRLIDNIEIGVGC